MSDASIKFANLAGGDLNYAENERVVTAPSDEIYRRSAL